MVDGDVPGVLQVDAVGVDAVAGGGDGHVEDLHAGAVVELEVALRAVLDGDAGHRHAHAAVESQRLSHTSFPVNNSAEFAGEEEEEEGMAAHRRLYVRQCPEQ